MAAERASSHWCVARRGGLGLAVQPGASARASSTARAVFAIRSALCSGSRRSRRRPGHQGDHRRGQADLAAAAASAPRPPEPRHGPVAIRRLASPARRPGRPSPARPPPRPRAGGPRARAPGSPWPARPARRRPRSVEPGQGVGQCRPRAALRWISPADRPGEGRLAGQDLAEDRAQGEDVGPLVDPVDLAPGLLGRHVRGVPITEPACDRSARPSRSGPWR